MDESTDTAEQSTGWDIDRVLTAIADVEDRATRGQKFLSDRISRLEKKTRGSFELDDVSEQIADLAKAVLLGYGAFLCMRALLFWIQQRQQQNSGS